MLKHPFPTIPNAVSLCALLTLFVVAQPCSQAAKASPQTPAQSNVAGKPDSPEVLAHIAKAKQIAGSEWATEEKVLCEQGRVNNAADPGAAKLFDNLYAIPGTYGTAYGVIYLITTSDGLLMIDSGWQKDVDSVLLPGLKKLGLDPANIKLIILTHGHADHYGG